MVDDYVIKKSMIEGAERCKENLGNLESPTEMGDQLLYTLPFEKAGSIHKLLAILEENLGD
jgi:hypothetical protein